MSAAALAHDAFAPRRPPVQTLTASWARTNFVYSTQLGVHAWRHAGEVAPGEQAPDAWDFELEPWVTAGKVRWCAPDGDRSALRPASGEACPFANLPGSRQRQIILADIVGGD